MDDKIKHKRKPDWLKIKLPKGANYVKTNQIVTKYNLHTICSSGKCPNIGECWGRGTATFLILGEICTRSCKFCAVATGKPNPVDNDEPERIATSIKLMNLNHCVITSVDRDDLPDGGAEIWAKTVKAIKTQNPEITIETLIPDFDGNELNIAKLIEVKPDIISHNLETVARLTPMARSRAKYDLSLKVLKQIADSGIPAKSGIMLGLGETKDEVYQTMDDLLTIGCRIFTIGQYLQPTKKHLPVTEYVRPEIFEEYRIVGLQKGMKFVESSPLVRSSYQAEKHVGK